MFYSVLIYSTEFSVLLLIYASFEFCLNNKLKFPAKLFQIAFYVANLVKEGMD